MGTDPCRGAMCLELFLCFLVLMIFLFIGLLIGAIGASSQNNPPFTPGQYTGLAPSNLRSLSLHVRKNDPTDPMKITPSNDWVALVCGVASLASSLISLVLWILTVYFAVKQRNLLLELEMPQFIIHAPGVPAYDPTVQIQYVQPVNGEFVQYPQQFPQQFPQQYQQAQFAPVPQPFGVKE